MKFLDMLIILLLFVLLGLGFYIFWLNYPAGDVEFEDYELDIPYVVTESEIQFYPKMRYRDRIISYSISDGCDRAQKLDAEDAFSILAERTVLTFNRLQEGGNAEIKIFCSDLAPEPDEEGHFVAGEGGPSEIINISTYSIIFSGKVSLYRENKCDQPNVAMHEILHALGFDHNNNERSIMFPLTNCDQKLDDYIVDEIDDLYKVESKVDLAIEKIKANKSGRYLSFEIVVGNFGLKDSEDSRLVIYVVDEFVKDFDLEKIEIGTRKILEVENLRIPRGSEVITFKVESFESELDSDNNRVDVGLVEG